MGELRVKSDREIISKRGRGSKKKKGIRPKEKPGRQRTDKEKVLLTHAVKAGNGKREESPFVDEDQLKE